MSNIADTIGGFHHASPNCDGCGKPLLLENAWMSCGCPCNSGWVNNENETRWRLLMSLQQRQSHQLEKLRAENGRLEALVKDLQSMVAAQDRKIVELRQEAKERRGL